MSTTYTDFEPVFKEIYANSVSDVTFQDNPLLALLPKAPDYGGKGKQVPIRIATPQGVSADIAVALQRAALNSSALRSFDIKHTNLYGCAVIPGDAIKGSLSDKTAFVRIGKFECDGVLQATSHVLNVNLYRNGYGKLGVIRPGTAVSGTTLQLDTVEDALNVEVGMELVVAASEFSAATRTLGTSGYGLVVTGVNTTDGILSFATATDDAATGIPAIAAGDTLFLRGNRLTTSTTNRAVVCGLESWLPAAAPSPSENFKGVDRSGNSRLYGLYYNAANEPLVEVLMEADQRVTSTGGKLDHFLMHPKTWMNLAKSLEGKTQFCKGSTKVKNADVSFSTIEYMGMSGQTVKLVADRACQVNKIWGLELKSWELNHMGSSPVEPWSIDGNNILRVSQADALEFRSSFYGELACNAPGHNIHIAI